MKIGILTVPFNNNYGGFLQAYALKTVIKNTGNEVIFIRRERPRKLWWDIKSIIKWLIGKGDYVFFREYKKRKASKFTDAFQHRYLYPMTESFNRPITYQSIKKYGIDKFIVGSDQVWRYQYAQSSIFNYFFDFLQGTNIPRMSYAASFGGNNEDFPKQDFDECTIYLENFEKILVREIDAVGLIEENNNKLRGKVKIVLDPTMLLQAFDYQVILSGYRPLLLSDNTLFSYILDYSKIKKDIREQIASQLKLNIINIKAQDPTLKQTEAVMPVEEWIYQISTSNFVVTDSFHGTVFSIIFHRPFAVISNKERGLNRLTSLLGNLDLMHHLITKTPDSIEIQNLEVVDWKKVDKKLNYLRKESLLELYEGLGYE